MGSNKKKALIFMIGIFSFIVSDNLYSQDNVGIGTNTPNSAAVLDIVSTTKGMLVPRVTTIQRNAIAANATTDGLLVYDTDFQCYFYWNTTTLAWVSLCQLSGPTGPTGANGTNGTNGATGPTGANGTNGTNGATGPTGANGTNGTNGATGPTGANGTNGTNGATGPTGANGTNGTNGATGPAGANGTNGTNGATGPTGANGTNGTNGATGPTGANGTNGTNGATGPTGANGTNGTNGATGPTGANGTNGTNGATGPTGANGTNGTNGATGPTGANGTNGTNGATGPTGANGTNGTNGATGPTGANGTNGTNGATGATGSTGPAGPVGCSTANYIIKSNGVTATCTTTPIFEDAINFRIGIGTTTPAYKLEVNADIYANGGWFRVSGNQGLYWETWGGGFYMSDATWIRTYTDHNIWTGNGLLGTQGGLTSGYGGTAPPVNGGIFAGAVGIGTSTPLTSNLVGESGVSSFNVHSTSQPAGGWFPVEITNTTTINACAGVAETNAASGFNANEGIVFYTGNAFGPAGIFGLSNANVGTGRGGSFTSNSAAGIGVYGQAPAATWAGYFNGNVFASGNYFVSDRRLKTNIVPIESSLDKLMQLTGYTYDFKSEYLEKYGLNSGKNYGIIADEVEKVFPDLLKETKLISKQEGKSNQEIKNEVMDIQTVNYNGLIPVLIEAIKEQQKMIDAMKKEIEDLKNK